jgi:putative Holliday junction resolvase
MPLFVGTIAFMRHLGIDYGTKKVGLALSDEAGTMGFPRGIVANDDTLVATISELIEKEHVGAVVIGDSLNFNGEPNAVAEAARTFGKSIGEATGLPVFFEQELFTTQEARRGLDGLHPGHVSDSARKTAKKGAEPVDASAAALILTSYLSRI